MTNSFDAIGRLSSVRSAAAGHAFHTYANGFGYNEKGVLDKMRLGNGLWEGLQANDRFQTTQITLGTTVGGGDRLKLDYDYGTTDNNGNVKSQTITVPTIGTATGFVTTQAYSYDELNRLSATSETQYGQTTPDWQQQFGYDRFGNRAMQTGTGQTFGQNSLQTTSLIGPDPTVSQTNNRITSKTGEQYQFDASGNMTKDALGNRSVFDPENHQTEYYYAGNSTSTPDAQYLYDGDGRRIKKVVGSAVTIFVYDAAGKMVAEYTQNIAPPPTRQTSYLTTDALGSVRVVTDAAGNVIARHDYLPFGDEIVGLGGRTANQGFGQPDNTRQRFTGYEKDDETGLDFAQARYYGNGLGRFTSVDLTLDSAVPVIPQSWNRYLYSLNNPVNLSDPGGMDPMWFMPLTPRPGDNGLLCPQYRPDGTPPDDGVLYMPLPDYYLNYRFDGVTEELERSSATPEILYDGSSESAETAGPSPALAGQAVPMPLPEAPSPPLPPLRLVPPPEPIVPPGPSVGTEALSILGRCVGVVGFILASPTEAGGPGIPDSYRLHDEDPRGEDGLNQIFLFRGVNPRKLSPSQFRFDHDGLSVNELPSLAHPANLKLTGQYYGPKVPGTVAIITTSGLEDATATFTPLPGDPGHWSVNMSGADGMSAEQRMSNYAKEVLKLK